MKRILLPFVLLILILFGISFLPIGSSDSQQEEITKTEVITADRKEKLNKCAKEIEEKNKMMMYPTKVGNWKMLDEINVYRSGDKIQVEYRMNLLFKHEKRLVLDTMQSLYAKNAGCSKNDVITITQ